MGILTVSTKERLEQLEQQRETLKTSILQAQIARPQYSKEQIVQWISRFKYGNINDKAYQREIIDVFVNSVYVYDDKLVLTYNFKDGTQTITLKEIEDALSSDMTCVAPPEQKTPPKGWCLILVDIYLLNPNLRQPQFLARSESGCRPYNCRSGSVYRRRQRRNSRKYR